MAKSKLLRIAKSPRVLILMAAIIIALVAIVGNPFIILGTILSNPQGLFDESIEIKNLKNSSAAELAGLEPGERIISIDNKEVKSLQDFAELTANKTIGEKVSIETDRNFYTLEVKPEVRIVTLPELQEVNVTGSDANESNETIFVNKTIEEVIGTADLGIIVSKSAKTRIKTGLDLQGGTRVLLRPEEKLSDPDLDALIANMNRRLNVFGLSDVIVRDASDFSGEQFILVEIAGVNEREVKNLISRQGKFEAKVGNVSVFKGLDVEYVCRSAECSGIDYQNGGCQNDGTGWFCSFFFSITLKPEAAASQADATRNLSIIDGYLSEKLFLYLDDELVEELNIGEELKGKPRTSIQISGSGSGTTKNAAEKDAISNMRQLQTILLTGSLPVKLEISRTDSISPALGREFGRNALLTGLVAITAVMVILLIAYRRIAVAVPIVCISMIEIFLLLGVAALIKWNIDLAAIAGIIAAVGTGVNDQIIITDEALKGEARRLRSWSDKIKSAFSVIFGAYFTMLFAMIPLFLIGAGLLRGFAVTTIIGITVGVLITRPAYAKIIEILTED